MIKSIRFNNEYISLIHMWRYNNQLSSLTVRRPVELPQPRAIDRLLLPKDLSFNPLPIPVIEYIKKNASAPYWPHTNLTLQLVNSILFFKVTYNLPYTLHSISMIQWKIPNESIMCFSQKFHTCSGFLPNIVLVMASVASSAREPKPSFSIITCIRPRGTRQSKEWIFNTWKWSRPRKKTRKLIIPPNIKRTAILHQCH